MANLTLWQRTARQTPIDTPWLKVHADAYDLPDGKKIDSFTWSMSRRV